MLNNIEFLILSKILKAKKGRLRPSEIKKQCNLTEPTMHKYLKKLVKKEYLLRKRGKERGVYPPPIYYHINSSNEELQNLLIFSDVYNDEERMTSKISKTYVKFAIAKEIIKECGLDADIEIEKRYHERYCVKEENTGEVISIPLPPLHSKQELEDEEKKD